MFCMASVIWSTYCCISCSRSLSISCSNRCSRLGRVEVVALQLAHLAGEVVGQHVEAEVALHRRVAREVGAALVAALLGLVRAGSRCAWRSSSTMSFSSSAISLVDAAEVAAVLELLALLAQLLHQLAQALHALAVAVAEALLHHPPQALLRSPW